MCLQYRNYICTHPAKPVYVMCGRLECVRRRAPDGKDANIIPFKCPDCKSGDLDLAIAEHRKWEEEEAKLTEERRDQARRNEGLGPLARVNKVLGKANAVLADTGEWFQKYMESNGPNAARKSGWPRQAIWPAGNDSTMVPRNPDDIPLESLDIRTPEPTYHPSISPLIPSSGNPSSAAATDSHKKQDEEDISPCGKENKKHNGHGKAGRHAQMDG